MKKLLTVFVSLMLVTVFAFQCFADAVPPADGTQDGAVSSETETGEYAADEETGEPEETEETDEEDELPEGSLGKDEYYYITQEEFEEYRREFVEISAGEMMAANLGSIGTAFLYLFAPLAVPFTLFVPFGGLIAAAFLAGPIVGLSELFETFFGSVHYILHKKQILNDFSVDNLYAVPVIEYVCPEDDSEVYEVVTGYEIEYTPDGEIVCADYRRVAIKED